MNDEKKTENSTLTGANIYRDSREYIKENRQYIAVTLILLANLILGVFNFNAGLIFPEGWSAWVLYLLSLLLTPILLILCVQMFRNKGLENGHKEIKEIYQQFLALQKRKEFKPRSKAQYLKSELGRDIATKYSVALVASIIVIDAVVNFSWSTLLGIILNLFLAIFFGIFAQIKAELFVIEELSLWYKIEIEKNTHKEDEVCRTGTDGNADTKI